MSSHIQKHSIVDTVDHTGLGGAVLNNLIGFDANGLPGIDTGIAKADVFLRDGSIAMTGNIALNGHYLSNDGDNEGIQIDNSGNIGIGAAPDVLLHLSTATTTELRLETSGASDPTLSFKTTNTANQINIYLDESSGHDFLAIAGQTAGTDVDLEIQALDGQCAYLRLASGANFSRIGMTSADELVIENTAQNRDIVFQILDGVITNEILRIDAANSRIGVSATTGDIAPDRLFHIEEITALAESSTYPFRLSHTSSASIGSGFGVGQEYELEDDDSGMDVAGITDCSWSNAGAGAESAIFDWKLMNGGVAAATKMWLSSTGHLTVSDDLTVNEYTKLGSSAPNIKVKKLSFTTHANQGGSVQVAIGMDKAKVLLWDIFIEYGAPVARNLPPGLDAILANAKYEAYLYDGGVPDCVVVQNTGGLSGGILNKPGRITIIYEE